MIDPLIYAAILNSYSETAIAQAFRRAAGIVDFPPHDDVDIDSERNTRYWRRMMHQRTGVCG